MKRAGIMKRLIGNIFICFLLLSVITACSIQGRGKPGEPVVIDKPQIDGALDGEIIVGIDRSVPASSIDVLVPGTRVKTIASINCTSYLLYNLFDKTKTDIILISLMSSGKVKDAEKNALYSLYKTVPDDQYYSQYQYSPKITDCEDGWDIEKGNSAVTVAVIDTGINGLHEDLLGRVTEGWNILAGAAIAEGTNSDDIGHGTHVSGIIAAEGNNGKGIAGVAWKVNLMPVKVFAPDVVTSSAYIAEGIVFAVDHGAKIANMSIGGGVYSMIVADAVNYAYDHDVVIIAAMGNDGKTKINYPAALPGSIAVGCTNGRDEVSYFSTRGNFISVCAPGESIWSLSNNSDTGYLYMSGTSMATPFVTGLAALLLSHDSTYKPDEVRSVIEDSADPLGPDAFSPAYGHGRVNVYKALLASKHNNYGSIRVNVANNGNPIGGIKVLVEDEATSEVVQSGLTSAGSAAGGVNGQIAFHHIPLGSYKIMVQVGTAQDQSVTLANAGDTVDASFAFTTPMVLLVNGIKVLDNSLVTDEFFYEQKLTALGKYFSIWKVAYNGPPPAELVDAYDTVIWFTGRTKDDSGSNIEVLGSGEVSAIKSFLDKGGRMYLCGNNIAEHLSQADPDFLANYLHATFVRPQLPHDELIGSGFLSLMDIILNPNDDDQIDPGIGATGLLDSSGVVGVNEWAGLSWNTGYRLVFTTFCPTADNMASCYPDTLFEDTIAWLDSTN
jgi:subtilisin family serine protease